MLCDLMRIFRRSEIRTGESLKKHCTYRIGGEAKYFISAQDVLELAEGVAYLSERGVNTYVLGRGGNTLFADEGFDGVVISTLKLNGVCRVGESVFADCGATGKKVVSHALSQKLVGGEFLYGIPSSVGGAVRMNAGAYGGEVKDILQKVWVLREGRLLTFCGKELDMSYRKAGFMRENDLILRAEFALTEGDAEKSSELIQQLQERRRLSQPLELPSCGSVFKRPQGGYAAELIERAGLKGMKMGGAMVSDKHAGFIVNFDNAKCGDVLNLIDYIQKEVYNRYSIFLEREVIVVR